MENLKGELVRITTKDGLELHSLLFEPSRKVISALIHVHGWNGNLYENKFIDFVAKEVVGKGFAFLTFNNRGTGFITDLIRRKKGKVEYVKIGGSVERLEDCVIDIKATVDFLSKRGYKKIILQGHSTGCQKITLYQYRTRDKRVKGLIELAPVDDAALVKRLLGKKYEKSLKIVKSMIKEGKDEWPIPKWISFTNSYGKIVMLTAKRYLDIADPQTLGGRLFDYSGKLKEIKNIGCPVLAIFGSKDEYEYKPEEKLKILMMNVKNCDIKLIKNASHGFVGFETNLSRLIGSWLKDNFRN